MTKEWRKIVICILGIPLLGVLGMAFFYGLMGIAYIIEGPQ